MRGKPIHLCQYGHSMIPFTDDACPWCADKKRIAELEAALKVALNHAKPEPETKEGA